MKKEVRVLAINSLIEVSGSRYYIIERDPDRKVALIQSECGKIKKEITFECEVEVIGEIEKVKVRGFEPVLRKFAKCLNHSIEKGLPYYILPTRKTSGSSGYDFSAPSDVVLPSHKVTVVMTNVKAYMLHDEELQISIRSGLSTKGIMCMNPPGKIDSDYYGNETNDGNIGFIFYNLNDEDYIIRAGDRIGQGTFSKYLIIDNDQADGERTGGMGSTGR